VSRLDRRRAALLVIDIQDRLVPAMPSAIAAQVVRNAGILVQAARRLGLPIIVTEQYPRGLGATVPALAAALTGDGVDRLEKLSFSAVAAPGFAAIAERLGRDQWVICGMETHVCVYQTIADLRARGQAVHLAVDAASSRTKANWKVGQALAAGLGAVLSSTEACVFDLLGAAGTDDFKALAPLVK
jgi:nicotinamidase-related amidase